MYFCSSAKCVHFEAIYTAALKKEIAHFTVYSVKKSYYTLPKFLAHDEKHTSSRVALSFCRALKKLEVGRAAFRTPPSTPPGRLLSPPCSHTNPHKVSKKLPKKRNVETIYCCYFVSVKKLVYPPQS